MKLAGAFISLCLLASVLFSLACTAAKPVEPAQPAVPSPPPTNISSPPEKPPLVEKHSEGRLAIGHSQPDQVYTIDLGTALYHKGDIGVVGNGKLLINGKLYLTGHLYIAGNGTAIVDGGELHIDGNNTNIYVSESGKLIFRNNARLHYVQFYVAQHNIIAWGNGRVELRDSSVDCDKSIEFIWMVNNASYEAVNVNYHHWKTWYLWNNTSLKLEDVNLAGDIVFYDSPTMSFKNTSAVMPWLHFGQGAKLDYQFPTPVSPSSPVTATLKNGMPGISGIPWTLDIENCRHVAWGVNPYPGSDVTVKDSDLTMVMFRFLGNSSFDLKGMMVANSRYDDATIPVADRKFRLVNTRVKWWKVDTEDAFKLNADSIVFSEMIARDKSHTEVTNSVCQGQTIHLGALDDAYLAFRNGEVWSYVSAWKNATMVLESSIIDWEKGKKWHGYIYQTRNIAHDNSRLYCLNTVMREKPEAMDKAVALFAFIEPLPQARIGSKITIRGSAWVKAGPQSQVAFDSYELSWSVIGSDDWNLIHSSSTEVREGEMGTWDTSDLKPGNYRIRLKVITSGDKVTGQYPAYREVEIAATST